MDKEKEAIIIKVIDRWNDTLGLQEGTFSFICRKDTGRYFLTCNSRELGACVFESDEFWMLKDIDGIPNKYLEKDLDRFFLDKSLYIYAWKRHELKSLGTEAISVSGDIYRINPRMLTLASDVYKFLEKWKSSCRCGIYTIKKEALEAFLLFYGNK